MTSDDKAALESIKRHLDRVAVDLEGIGIKYQSHPYKRDLIQQCQEAKNDILIRIEAALDD